MEVNILSINIFLTLLKQGVSNVFFHRDLPEKSTAEAQACASWLAHLVVRKQEEGSQISPWSLMCGLLLQVPTRVLTEEGLPWHQLTEKTLWLRKLALDFGARLNWPGV